MTDFATLTFERSLKKAPAQVFDALTKAEARTVWGPPDTGHVVLIEGQPDPAPGLREVSRCGPTENPYVTVHTDWVIMEASSRLVYAETLIAEDTVLGVTLAVAELTEVPEGTQLSLHLDLTSFVGAEAIGEFEAGWSHALGNLVAYVDGI